METDVVVVLLRTLICTFFGAKRRQFFFLLVCIVDNSKDIAHACYCLKMLYNLKFLFTWIWLAFAICQITNYEANYD